MGRGGGARGARPSEREGAAVASEGFVVEKATPLSLVRPCARAPPPPKPPTDRGEKYFAYTLKRAVGDREDGMVSRVAPPPGSRTRSETPLRRHRTTKTAPAGPLRHERHLKRAHKEDTARGHATGRALCGERSDLIIHDEGTWDCLHLRAFGLGHVPRSARARRRICVARRVGTLCVVRVNAKTLLRRVDPCARLRGVSRAHNSGRVARERPRGRFVCARARTPVSSAQSSPAQHADAAGVSAQRSFVRRLSQLVRLAPPLSYRGNRIACVWARKPARKAQRAQCRSPCGECCRICPHRCAGDRPRVRQRHLSSCMHSASSQFRFLYSLRLLIVPYGGISLSVLRVR